MQDNYTYPCILDYSEEDIINIIFPDNYIEEAQDFLALLILDYEANNRKAPEASREIEIEKAQKLIYVNVWMPYHRSKTKEIFVKKTLTIPSWLDILAKKSNVNFSSVLVKALKEELGIQRKQS